MNTTNEVMTRYILGQLDDRESQELEESFFGDDAVFDALMVAEGELIEAYLHGELPDEQQALFESQLKNSPKRRSRVEMARLLVAEAQRNQGFPPGSTRGGPANESGSTLGSGIAGADLPVSKPGRRTLYRALPAAACLVMAVVTGWSWQEANTAHEAKASLEAVADSEKKARIQAEEQLAAAPQNFALEVPIHPITRSAAALPGPPTLEVTSEGGVVTLLIRCYSIREFPTYRLEVTLAGSNQGWSRTGMVLDDSEDAEASFLLEFSARELPAGEYEVAIFAEGEGAPETALAGNRVVVEKSTPQP